MSKLDLTIKFILLVLLSVFSLIGSASEQVDQLISPVEQIVLTEPELYPNPNLLEQLAIIKGKGQFLQKKYFKFLSKPITSNGSFIVSEQSALWQTEMPVFSQLLVTPSAIYKRLSTQEKYQSLIESIELSSILATIFNGQINPKDWQQLELNTDHQNCISLKPQSEQLSQIFKYTNLCLLEKNQRQIELIDNNNNKTEILMSLVTSELEADDIKQLQHEQQ